jgi:hypothetical protein
LLTRKNAPATVVEVLIRHRLKVALLRLRTQWGTSRGSLVTKPVSRNFVALVAVSTVALFMPAGIDAAFPTVAGASPGSCTTLGPWYVGHTSTHVSGTGRYPIEGVSTDMVNEDSSLCTGDQETSNLAGGFVKIQDSGSNQSEMDVGFRTWYDSSSGGAIGPYFVAEYSDYHDNGGGLVISANPISGHPDEHYWITFSTSCACDKALINSDDYLNTDESPRGNWTLPISAYYGGSAMYKATDVPGVSSSETYMHALQIQDVTTGDPFEDDLQQVSAQNDNTNRWSQDGISSGGGQGNYTHFWSSSP